MVRRRADLLLLRQPLVPRVVATHISAAHWTIVDQLTGMSDEEQGLDESIYGSTDIRRSVAITVNRSPPPKPCSP